MKKKAVSIILTIILFTGGAVYTLGYSHRNTPGNLRSEIHHRYTNVMLSFARERDGPIAWQNISSIWNENVPHRVKSGQSIIHNWSFKARLRINERVRKR